MLQKLAMFMSGRYGFDKLNFVLAIASIIISCFATLFDFEALSIISFVLTLYVIFRMFSKNIPMRQKEYYSFLKLWTPIEKWFTIKKKAFDDRASYKYFKCPNCSQQLRAPKGRGKILVTCQKCRKEFSKKV